MQYMVAGMMFGQGNYLAHYGRKGMKWGENIFGDDYEGGKHHTQAPAYSSISKAMGSRRMPAKFKNGAAYRRQNQINPNGSFRTATPSNTDSSSDWLRNYYGKTRQIRGAANAASIGVNRWATNTYNRAASGVRSAYNTASGYANRGIDAVSNRDEYARLQEAIQNGADSDTLRMLQETYDSHWMTRAQRGIQSGVSFAQRLFGQASDFAKQTWSSIKERAASYVNSAKNWLSKIWNSAKTIPTRIKTNVLASRNANAGAAARNNYAYQKHVANRNKNMLTKKTNNYRSGSGSFSSAARR